MPNWTSNIVHISGGKELLEKIEEDLKSEDSIFDFNKVIPMPESLKMESGSITDESVVTYLTDGLKEKPDKEKHKELYAIVKNPFSEDWPAELWKRLQGKESLDKLYELGRQYVDNYRRYGTTTWYEWAVKHWGTKWNNTADDVTVDHRSATELVYCFDTAWSAPEPVFLALSEKYPVQIVNEANYEDDPLTNYVSTYVGGKILHCDTKYLQ